MLTLIFALVVVALVAFLVAGLWRQNVGNYHFGWLGAAALTASYLLQQL